MKIFKKWNNNSGCKIKVDCGDMNCRDCEIIKKTSWRAALEWALDELRHDVNGFFNIIKELEDE